MDPLYPSFTPTYHHDQYPAIDPTQPHLSCSDKIILITGAGRGIGRAVAIAFAHARARGIALLGRTSTTLSETAAHIREISPSTDVFEAPPADITSAPQIQTALDAVVAHYNAVPHVLVNNAGGADLRSFASLTDVDLDELWKCFELNAKGPLIVAQAFLRAQRAHKSEASDIERTIINVASGSAHLPYFPTGAAYSCAKLASAKLAEYLHYENPGWRVFNMQPGVVDTDLARRAGRKAPDNPRLPAGLAVWLAASEEAVALNGRFLWANWDVSELMERKEDIREKGLLTLTLKGWAEGYSDEDLIARARSVQKK